MKKQFIETLKQGDVVNDYFVATRRDLRPMQNGGKFLGMVFKDRTGEIGGVLWNNAESVASQFELGDVVNVRGTVNTYQNRLQVRVDQVVPLKESEFNPADLVFEPDDSETLAQELRTILGTIENDWLKKLVQAFLSDNDFMSRFEQAAAGKKWHHAYRGGLLRHCVEMARIAETVCKIFPHLNRDLILSGVFLHDIGKLDEMSHDLYVDYTTVGRLVGHLQIGCNMVSKKIAEIDGFPENLYNELAHLILSHHGELVNGSPVTPKTTEAVALYLIDNLDAQIDAFSRITEETRKKKLEWSDYLAQIERQIWAKPDP